MDCLNNSEVQDLIKGLGEPCLPKDDVAIYTQNQKEELLATATGASLKSSKVGQLIPLRCNECSKCTACPSLNCPQKKRCKACLKCGRCKAFHVEQSLKLEHPSSKLSAAMPHVNAVLEANGERTPEEINRFRVQIMLILQELEKVTKPFNDKLLQMVHPSIRRVLDRWVIPSADDKESFKMKQGAANIASLFVLIHWSKYPDQDVVIDMLKGFPIVGKQKGCKLWDLNTQFAKESMAALPVEALIDEYELLNECSLDRAIGVKQNLADDLWNETRKDLFRGIAYGPFKTFDESIEWLNANTPDSDLVPKELRDKFGLLAPRFANVADRPNFDKKTKIFSYVKKTRAIDDTSFSKLNLTHVLEDKMRLPSIRSICVQALLAKKLLAGHNCDILAFASDESAAFRACPVLPSHLRFCITCQPPVHTTTVSNNIFTTLGSCIFGMSPSVLAFGRKSEPPTHIGRCLSLAIDKFVDDSWCLDSAACAESGYELFKTLNKCLGTHFAHNKDQKPAITAILLGVLINFKNLTVEFTEEKKAQRLIMIREAIESRRLLPSTAESLTGKIQWADFLLVISDENVQGGWTFKKAMSRLRHQFLGQKTSHVSDKLVEALKILYQTVDESTPRCFKALDRGNPSSPDIVWTDGSEEGGKNPDDPKFRGTGLVYIPGENKSSSIGIIAAGVTDQMFINKQLKRKKQIVLVELNAIKTSIDLLGDRLKGRYIIWFVDNRAAFSMLSKGSGKQADQDWLVAVILRALDKAGAKVHWQFVPTNQNVSDIPSRQDYHSDKTLVYKYCHGKDRFKGQFIHKILPSTCKAHRSSFFVSIKLSLTSSKNRFLIFQTNKFLKKVSMTR